MIKMIRRAVTASILAAASMMPVSCVHQWPEEPEMRDAILTVTHLQLDWDYYHFVTNYRSRYDSGRPLQIRYIFRIFPEGEQSICVSQTTLYSDDLSRTDFTAQITVPVGRYELRVWSDLVDRDTKEPLYYDATDFKNITYATPYRGGTAEKDAFRGVMTVDVPSTTKEDVHITGTIQLERPLTAFAFVSTDLDEFVRSEIARRGVDSQQPGDGAATDTPAAPLPDFSGYKVTVSYPGFLPWIYHHFNDKPVDSNTGVKFDTDISIINDREALVGFDSFFINGTESGVRAALDFYDPTGKHIASVPGVDIPVKRGRCTIVRGEFLTSKASGSTGINPDFDGEFNIPWN